MFLPTTKPEMKALGWDALDVILVTGDAYIDSPYVGVALIGKLLHDAGYRVGVIGQPERGCQTDIARVGEPRLFWGVSGGSVDSMVANHTALKKRRRRDDYTPGGLNNRRPDRAVIVYVNLIREHFKATVPIVLGGVEASLRRISHYDYWSDNIRRSILLDAKADLLVYGMGEGAVLEIAAALRSGGDARGIRGSCHLAKERPPDALELPPHQEVQPGGKAFAEMYRRFCENQDPQTARTLCQRQDSRYLVHNRPAEFLPQEELDRIHELSFERAAHPFHTRAGVVRALETIRFSLPAMRGCYGGCSFCSIAVHEGRTVRWRSEPSLLREARAIAALPDFKGYIHDVGGPTANMYGFECARKLAKGVCNDKHCLHPEVCTTLEVDHSHQIDLLRKLRQIPGVKKVFVASGLRHDLVLADKKHGAKYTTELARHHVSGQLKLAPEHSESSVLAPMGKPGPEGLLEFRRQFLKASRAAGKRQFLTYYLIAAHPGCGEQEMWALRTFVSRELKLNPKQVQVFTPLPSTWSTVMYVTGEDPFTGEQIYVERDLRRKAAQKEILVPKDKGRRRK